jgi:hypothetical protein
VRHEYRVGFVSIECSRRFPPDLYKFDRIVGDCGVARQCEGLLLHDQFVGVARRAKDRRKQSDNGKADTGLAGHFRFLHKTIAGRPSLYHLQFPAPLNFLMKFEFVLPICNLR